MRLEATMAELAARIDELQIDLLRGETFGLRNQRLKPT